ncbi:MAG: hypothetical protein K2J37_05445 [Ruminococcus sp.]|nr:hypothetical protein [Ruminococcus sp.]MDE6784472.1 hypothetical protein [Ruminococcus sp.]
MKKTEKDKLKEAFNIPEPVHKEQFISKYGDMLKKNEHKLRFSTVIRYSAYATFAVLIIGVWGAMNVNPDFADKFKGNDIIESAVTTSAVISANTVNTTSVGTNAVSTESTVSAETNSETKTNAATTKTSPAVSSLPAPTGKSSTSKTETTRKYTPAPTEKAPAIHTESSVKTDTSNTSARTTKTLPALSTTKIISTVTKPQTTSYRTAPASTTRHIDTPQAAETEANSPPPMTVPQTTRPQPTQNNNTTTTTPAEYAPPVCADPVRNFAVPPVIYQKDENAVYIYDIFKFGGSAGSSPPMDNITIDAQSIVCAEIINVIYTQFNNKPYTQLNLLVKYSLSGNIQDYSKISLYVRGGYMPASEYAELNGIDYEHETNNETIIYDYGESEKIFDISDVGSEYIFIIGYDSGNLPENVYQTVTDSDKSVINPDDFKNSFS